MKKSSHINRLLVRLSKSQAYLYMANRTVLIKYIERMCRRHVFIPHALIS